MKADFKDMKYFYIFFILIISLFILIQVNKSSLSASVYTISDNIIILGIIDSVYGNAGDSLIISSDSLIQEQKKIVGGKVLYKSRCGKCHKLHKPSEYTAKEWKRNLIVMKDKAELTKAEYQLIIGYLSANSNK